MFAVVDVETTGGYSDNHRIIEIGIAISDGQTIVERFNSLVQPHKWIPNHITQLTGISNDDVKDAPAFSEIASTVFELLQGQIFVAHNVNFDFSFVHRELELAGYTWKPKKLCTVRLTRKIVPGLKSYSLGNLAQHFKIVNPNPHRALADAETAAEILHILRKTDVEAVDNPNTKGTLASRLPMNLNPDVYHALPETPGVYYMKNEVGENIYIGKAVNIKSRINQHFSGSSGGKRRQQWIRDIHDIQFIETGSEALALLHEDHEIRHYWPVHNAAQKHPVAKWGVVSYTDRKGVPRLAVQRAEKRVEVIEHFYSLISAQQFIAELAKTQQLNPKLCGLGYTSDVTPEDHTDNLRKWLNEVASQKRDGVIWYEGRDITEVGFVLISNGEYAGIGILSRDLIDSTTRSLLEENLWHHHESPTSRQILQGLLKEGVVMPI